MGDPSPNSPTEAFIARWQGREAEKKIAAVPMSLARLGHVATGDGGQSFAIRRAA